MCHNLVTIWSVSHMQIVPDDVLKRLVQACKSGEFDLAHTEVTEIIAEGHPVSQIFSQVFSLDIVAMLNRNHMHIA